MTLREQDLTQGTSPGALKRVYVNDVPDTIASPSGCTIWRRCDFFVSDCVGLVHEADELLDGF